jgi:hypothetical protein
MSAYDFLQVHVHELEPDPAPDEAMNDYAPGDEAEPEPSDTLLINAAKGSRPISRPSCRYLLSFCPITQSFQPNWPILSSSYPIIKPLLGNPCHSFIECQQ